MSFIIGIVSGLISGIISSIIANVLIKKNKPNLLISDKFSKSKNNSSNYEYKIKVINKSKEYLKNVKISAQLMTSINAVGGVLLSVKPVHIVYNDINLIDPYNKDDENARYAIRIRLDDNLEKIWDDDNHTYLEVKIYGENESNGSGKVFRQVYNKKKHSLVLGEFDSKESMMIQETI